MGENKSFRATASTIFVIFWQWQSNSFSHDIWNSTDSIYFFVKLCDIQDFGWSLPAETMAWARESFHLLLRLDVLGVAIIDDVDMELPSWLGGALTELNRHFSATKKSRKQRQNVDPFRPTWRLKERFLYPLTLSKFNFNLSMVYCVKKKRSATKIRPAWTIHPRTKNKNQRTQSRNVVGEKLIVPPYFLFFSFFFF